MVAVGPAMVGEATFGSGSGFSAGLASSFFPFSSTLAFSSLLAFGSAAFFGSSCDWPRPATDNSSPSASSTVSRVWRFNPAKGRLDIFRSPRDKVVGEDLDYIGKRVYEFLSDFILSYGWQVSNIPGGRTA